MMLDKKIGHCEISEKMLVTEISDLTDNKDEFVGDRKGCTDHQIGSVPQKRFNNWRVESKNRII